MSSRRPLSEEHGNPRPGAPGQVIFPSATLLKPFERRGQRGILVVDDSEDDAAFLRRTLRKAGVTKTIRMVHDGELAIAYLRSDPPFSDRKQFPLPSIIFLDVYLPNRSGFEVLKWLRSQPRFQNTFVAVMTGAGNVGDIARAYNLGANSFLSKPCRPEDIRNLIEGFPSHWSDCVKPTADENGTSTPLKKTLRQPRLAQVKGE